MKTFADSTTDTHLFTILPQVVFFISLKCIVNEEALFVLPSVFIVTMIM